MYLSGNTLLQGGKYKIVRFLSSGGFGNTYEGVHTMMDTRVAIKEFFPKMFCNRDENTSHVTVATQGNRELVDKLRKKFNEEAKSVFQMKHENIVRVLDIFEENGTAYYVMEYIDGKSLNDITKERGALPESEAVGYILQVAEALKYVHSLNRLHLDIKPGNIMVDKNGKAILIDFGASKHYDDESGENTSTLMGVNTKGYAPIEQSTKSFTSFSPATDIYALGATLYKLLTGITPPDANLLLAKEATLAPIPESISTSTRIAVLKAMTLIRADRLQTIEEFLFLLDSKAIDNSDDENTVFEEENVKHQSEGALRLGEEQKGRAEVTRREAPKWKVVICLLLSVASCIFVWMLAMKHTEDLHFYNWYIENDMDGFLVPQTYIVFDIFCIISATLLFFMILYTGVNNQVKKNNWLMLLCSVCTVVYGLILLVIAKNSSAVSSYGEPMFTNFLLALWIVCTQLYWWTSIKKGLSLSKKAFVTIGVILSLLQLVGSIMLICWIYIFIGYQEQTVFL